MTEQSTPVADPPEASAPETPPAAADYPPAAPEGSWATPPPPPPSWDTKSQIGATCLVVVHKHSTGVLTQHGVRNCVDVTIIELAGPNPGVIFEDVSLYNSQLVGQLEQLVGQYTLGRFALGQGKGAQPPIVLNPPMGQDEDLARAWFAQHPGKMAELQAAGKLRADQPKPPPQWQQQPGPMQGQQWQNSPTNGWPQQPPQQHPGGWTSTGGQQPAQNTWGQQQPPPYPWNAQQAQQQPPPPQQQVWQQPEGNAGWQQPPPVSAPEAPPF